MSEETFNFQEKHLGKELIKDGQVAEFISICERPSFTVELKNGKRISGAIGSLIGDGWELVKPKTLKEKVIEAVDWVCKKKNDQGDRPCVDTFWGIESKLFEIFGESR